jgi:hypothetical protein
MVSAPDYSGSDAERNLKGLLNASSDVPTLATAIFQLVIMGMKQNHTTRTEWILAVLGFGAAALGLLSSVGSVEGVSNSGLRLINMWWIGFICWIVRTVIFSHVELKIEIERRRRMHVQEDEPEGGV